jgi:N-acetylmuramoyl-L-alanine amidase
VDALKIHWVVVHCSDSDVPAHDNIEVIRGWHKNERNFSDIGYHYFIDKSGAVYIGRSEDKIGAHVKGHNSGSLGICLSGRHDFTTKQFESLERLLKDICKRHELTKQDILGHRDLDGGKTCPNFDVHALISKWNWH